MNSIEQTTRALCLHELQNERKSKVCILNLNLNEGKQFETN